MARLYDYGNGMVRLSLSKSVLLVLGISEGGRVNFRWRDGLLHVYTDQDPQAWAVQPNGTASVAQVLDSLRLRMTDNAITARDVILDDERGVLCDFGDQLVEEAA